MLRNAFAILLGFSAIAVSNGCKHMVETRSIESFAEALQAEDLEDLRSATSNEFGRVALRNDKAIEQLKILRIPTGESTILDVKEISESERTVIAEITPEAGPAQKLRYRLIHDQQRNKWVVDDVDMVKSRNGRRAVKPITEQMDLLLTVFDFDSAWRQGTPSEILQVTTPGFRKELNALPRNLLTRVARETVGRAPSRTLQPNARLDDAIAFVRLPRSVGTLNLTLKQIDGRWAVDDAAILAGKNKSDRTITSTRERVGVIATASKFLRAYSDGRQTDLSELCSKGFYDGAIRIADSKSYPLPTIDDNDVQYELTRYGDHADFTLTEQDRVVNITLKRHEKETADTSDYYRIDDVTLYDVGSQQNMRLSALFSSHAIMRIYSESLANGDLGTLQRNSTTDLNQRVWAWFDGQTLTGLPLDRFGGGRPEILRSDFDGPVTRLTVRDGGKQIVYELREVSGQMLVSDVESDDPTLPGTLRETLELVVPVHSFVSGVRDGDARMIQRNVSFDFNRHVWHQLKTLPPAANAAARGLSAPLVQMERTSEQAVLFYGDEQFGARAILVKEQERFVLDDVVVFADRQSAKLKRELRQQIAAASSIGSPAQPAAPGDLRVPDGDSFGAPAQGVVPAGAQFDR